MGSSESDDKPIHTNFTGIENLSPDQSVVDKKAAQGNKYIVNKTTRLLIQRRLMF